VLLAIAALACRAVRSLARRLLWKHLDQLIQLAAETALLHATPVRHVVLQTKDRVPTLYAGRRGFAPKCEGPLWWNSGDQVGVAVQAPAPIVALPEDGQRIARPLLRLPARRFQREIDV